MAPDIAKLAQRLDAAIAKRNALIMDPKPDRSERHASDVAVDALFREAGFPKHEPTQADGSIVGFVDRTIFRVKDLDTTQREIIEHLAKEEHRYLGGYPFPSSTSARRRWLGLEPPGILFTEANGSTLFETLREAMRRDRDDAVKLLTDLPPLKRIEALTELMLLPGDYPTPNAEALLFEMFDEIDASFGNWGKAFAERLLVMEALPRDDRGADIRPLRFPTFLSLVRGKIEIEPRYDALLTLYSDWKPDLVRACVEAVPKDRREAALLGALGRMMFANDAVKAAAWLLPEHPHASIASFLLARLDQAWHPKIALGAVKTAAKAHPAIAEALAAHEKGKAPVPELSAAWYKKGAPKLAELDAIGKKQLEAASVRYSGKKLSAKEILAGSEDEEDETILPSTLERIRILDAKGKHAYDAWLYMGDSGCVFKAGTTKLVAERIQAGLDAADKQLRIALLAVLDGKPKKAPKPAKKKASAKKKTAAVKKKTPKKKASARKK